MVLFSEDHIQETRRRGRIEVICGSMFSGKTEELIRRLKRAKFARQRVEIFKPFLLMCAILKPMSFHMTVTQSPLLLLIRQPVYYYSHLRLM